MIVERDITNSMPCRRYEEGNSQLVKRVLTTARSIAAEYSDSVNEVVLNDLGLSNKKISMRTALALQSVYESEGATIAAVKGETRVTQDIFQRLLERETDRRVKSDIALAGAVVAMRRRIVNGEERMESIISPQSIEQSTGRIKVEELAQLPYFQEGQRGYIYLRVLKDFAYSGRSQIAKDAKSDQKAVTFLSEFNRLLVSEGATQSMYELKVLQAEYLQSKLPRQVEIVQIPEEHAVVEVAEPVITNQIKKPGISDEKVAQKMLSESSFGRKFKKWAGGWGKVAWDYTSNFFSGIKIKQHQTEALSS